MRWADAIDDAGWLGDAARSRLLDPGVLLVVTIRGDGTPRLSPCEPFDWDGELWLSMMHGSHKARDLQRDPRVLVHAIVTDRDGAEGEVKLRGRATEELDAMRVRGLCDAIGAVLPWQPEPDLVHPFRVDVESIAHVHYVDGDQHVAVWPARERFVRRITSATSVGSPEPLAWE